MTSFVVYRLFNCTTYCWTVWLLRSQAADTTMALLDCLTQLSAPSQARHVRLVCWRAATSTVAGYQQRHGSRWTAWHDLSPLQASAVDDIVVTPVRPGQHGFFSIFTCEGLSTDAKSSDRREQGRRQDCIQCPWCVFHWFASSPPYCVMWPIVVPVLTASVPVCERCRQCYKPACQRRTDARSQTLPLLQSLLLLRLRHYLAISTGRRLQSYRRPGQAPR